MAKLVSPTGVTQNMFLGAAELQTNGAKGVNDTILTACARTVRLGSDDDLSMQEAKKFFYRAFSLVTDGASANVRQQNGLWALLEKDRKNTELNENQPAQCMKTWCAAHRAQLAWKVSGQLPEWTQSRKTQSRKTQSRMDTIPNGHHPEWTQSRMDTIPNGHNPEWTQSRMDTIPNGHNPKWTQSRMDTIPNGHNPEWTQSRKDTIPNGHNPEWTQSRKDTIPNGHNPEWTRSRKDTIPNGHNPERTQSRMSTHNYIVTLVFNSYCLVRSLLRRRGFKQKLILCMNLSDLHLCIFHRVIN